MVCEICQKENLDLLLNACIKVPDLCFSYKLPPSFVLFVGIPAFLDIAGKEIEDHGWNSITYQLPSPLPLSTRSTLTLFDASE